MSYNRHIENMKGRKTVMDFASTPAEALEKIVEKNPTVNFQEEQLELNHDVATVHVDDGSKEFFCTYTGFFLGSEA